MIVKTDGPFAALGLCGQQLVSVEKIWTKCIRFLFLSNRNNSPKFVLLFIKVLAFKQHMFALSFLATHNVLLSASFCFYTAMKNYRHTFNKISLWKFCCNLCMPLHQLLPNQSNFQFSTPPLPSPHH